MDGTGDGPEWEEDPAAAPSRSVGDPREMPKGRGGDKIRREDESGGGTDGAGDDRARKQEAVVAPAAKKRKILADGGGIGMDGQVPPPNNSVGGPSLRKLRGVMKAKAKRSSGEGSGGGREAVVAPAANKRKILADAGGMDGQVPLPPPNNSDGGPSLRKLREMMKVKGKRSSGEGTGGGGSAKDGPVKVKEDRAVAPSMCKLTETPKGIGAGNKRREVGIEEADSGTSTSTSGAGDQPALTEEEVLVPTVKKQKILLLDDDVRKKASQTMKMTPSVAVAHTPDMPRRRAWKEEQDMVVEPPVKKQMTGGCGMVDAEDGMGIPILEEEVLASAKNKRKRTSSLMEGVCAKKAKRGRGSKSADCGGQKAKRGRGSKSADSGGLRRRNACGITVAYTPNILRRYGNLLGVITHLLPYKSQGKAYECSLNRIELLIKWSKCSQCLFFEWLEKDKRMICWIFNTIRRNCIKFLVNPVFVTQMLEGKAKHATCAFSLNFGSNETWTRVKETLEMLFCPQGESSYDTSPEIMYVFTRIDDCIYFRNMKIEKLPDIAHEDALVLKEGGPNFCLKLVGIHGESDAPFPASDISQSQMRTELIMHPTSYYSLPPEFGCCTSVHSFCLKGERFSVLLENGQDLSIFEGYSMNLQEFLQEQSFLKRKQIVGSKTDEKCFFARNIAKRIIRSIFAYLIDLFSSQRCIKMTRLNYEQILLKESLVKLYGVEFVNYEEKQAEQNVVVVVGLITNCFPQGMIPYDLQSMLDLLLEDPLQNLQAAKDDSSLQSAKERRDLLVYLHTEYMTNVKPKLKAGGDGQQLDKFFQDCPYLDTWADTVAKNTYLIDVANYNTLIGTMKLEKRKEEERKNMGEEQTKKKGGKKEKQKEKERKKREKDLKKRKERENERKEQNKDEDEQNKDGYEQNKDEDQPAVDGLAVEQKVVDSHQGRKGELQFHVMRNCDVHISESAVKDGITPFRLSWTDYIRTCYFPEYLPFIQRRMMQYMKAAPNESKVDKEVDKDGVPCRQVEEEKIVRVITSGQLSNDGDVC